MSCSFSAPGQNDGDVRFSAEAPLVQRTVYLPHNAMQAVTSDTAYFKEGAPADLTCVASEKADGKPQLLCGQVTLADRGFDYVAIGVGGLRGAHVVPFWLVHVEKDRATRLFSTVADALVIKSSAHHGFHDLAVTWVASGKVQDATLEFDGNSYKIAAASNHPQ